MEQLRVLLVGKDPDDVERTLAACARAAPHLRFTGAAGAEECRAQLARSSEPPFDAIALDLTRQGDGGLALFSEIVASDPGAPVLVITGCQDATAAAALELGAHEHLAKTSDYLEHLPRAIQSAVERYRLAAENQRLRDQLAANALEADAVFESLTDAIVIVDAAGQIIRTNAAAGDVMARVPEPTWRGPLERVLQGEGRGEDVIRINPDEPGGRVWSVDARPVHDAEGRVRLAVAVFRDISEFKRLDHLKDEIISIASHELKNPLTVIMGYGSLLSSMPEVTQSPRLSRAIGAVNHQSQRMRLLIDQLLDLSRLGLGRLALQSVPFDLAEQLRQVADQQQMAASHHRLQTVIEEKPLVVVGDPSRLEQVLVNLIDNAIKYCPDAEEIVLRLRRVEAGEPIGSSDEQHMFTVPCALVEVSDKGPGIDPVTRQHLFKRYYRGNTTSELADGIGLGLYISAHIVRLHGGAIWVESELGQGSTFSYVLPLP